MLNNPLPARLNRGDAIFGPVLRIPGPFGVEFAAAAGFDFVFIDMEHTSFSLPAAEVMILAAAATGISPIIRVPAVSRVAIHQVLDLGAHGVIVPQVSSATDAALVGEACRYGPAGARGVAGMVRGNGWGTLSRDQVNRSILAIVQIENEHALADLDGIASQPGVDVLLVGPNDLAQALGVPGEPGHARVVEATTAVIAAAKRHGKVAGIAVSSPEDAAAWIARGIQVITTGPDQALLRKGMIDLAAALRTAAAKG